LTTTSPKKNTHSDCLCTYAHSYVNQFTYPFNFVTLCDDKISVIVLFFMEENNYIGIYIGVLVMSNVCNIQSRTVLIGSGILSTNFKRREYCFPLWNFLPSFYRRRVQRMSLAQKKKLYSTINMAYKERCSSNSKEVGT